MALRRITSLRNFQQLIKHQKGQHTKYIHSATSDFQLPQLRTPLSAADTDDISECLKKILGDKNVAVSDRGGDPHGLLLSRPRALGTHDIHSKSGKSL